MSDIDEFVNAFHAWTHTFMHHSMRGHMHFARKKGLSRSMLGTLFFLDHHGNAGVRDLGEHLGVSSAAASQMLERLVDEGLIQRVEDPNDRRMKQITLTKSGTAVLQESIKARSQWVKDLVESFSPDEKELITKAMRLMTEKTHQLDLDCKKGQYSQNP